MEWIENKVISNAWTSDIDEAQIKWFKQETSDTYTS
jgi:hypothetical protein